MSEEKIKQNGKKVAAITSFFLILLLVTFGKFSIDKNVYAHATLLEPQTKIVSNEEGAEISIEKGNVGTYHFYITNRDGEDISQVKMDYKIDVITGSNYLGNVIYSLYHCDSEGTYDKEKDKIVSNQVGSIQNASNTWMNLPASTEKIDYYVLEFHPDTAGDFSFDIMVTSQQSK